MNRKFLLAISLASVLAAPSTAVYAEGEDEKKPEQPQLIAEGDEEKKPEQPQLLAEGEDEKKPEQPQLLAESDDSARDIERTDLIVVRG